MLGHCACEVVGDVRAAWDVIETLSKKQAHPVQHANTNIRFDKRIDGIADRVVSPAKSNTDGTITWWSDPRVSPSIAAQTFDATSRGHDADE